MAACTKEPFSTEGTIAKKILDPGDEYEIEDYRSGTVHLGAQQASDMHPVKIFRHKPQPDHVEA